MKLSKIMLMFAVVSLVAGSVLATEPTGGLRYSITVTKFDNKAGWEIRFIALPASGACRTGMEKSFQLDGNKVYWSHTGAEQMAWRCVTSPSGRQLRLVASSPQPPTTFADVGLGRVVASGKRISAS